MKPLRITKKNSTFQILIALKTNRTKRSELKEIFIEGTVGIKAAAAAGRHFKRFVYEEHSRLSDWARRLLASNPETELISMQKDLYEELCDRDEPSELVATIEKETLELKRAEFSEVPFVLVLDRPSNHGNLGSIIRSANAFGIELIITLGHSVDAFDPAVIRSSRGSIFLTPICAEPSPKAFLAWLEELKITCPQLLAFGTDSKGEYSLPGTQTISRPAVLLIGNEAKGLSVELKRLVDKMIRIPMSGNVDSLNVACATSILLYELFNRSVRSNAIV